MATQYLPNGQTYRQFFAIHKSKKKFFASRHNFDDSSNNYMAFADFLQDMKDSGDLVKSMFTQQDMFIWHLYAKMGWGIVRICKRTGIKEYQVKRFLKRLDEMKNEYSIDGLESK